MSQNKNEKYIFKEILMTMAKIYQIYDIHPSSPSAKAFETILVAISKIEKTIEEFEKKGKENE